MSRKTVAAQETSSDQLRSLKRVDLLSFQISRDPNLLLLNNILKFWKTYFISTSTILRYEAPKHVSEACLYLHFFLCIFNYSLLVYFTFESSINQAWGDHHLFCFWYKPASYFFPSSFIINNDVKTLSSIHALSLPEQWWGREEWPPSYEFYSIQILLFSTPEHSIDH